MLVPFPIPLFFDRTGQALEDGYIYIGEAGQNAQANPIVVYWDEGLTQTVAQPIRTSQGFPAYQGAPSRLFVAEAAASVTVLDKDRQTILMNAPVDASGGGGGTTNSAIFDSRAEAQGTYISSAVEFVITGGYAAAGDGGNAQFIRDTGPLSDGASFQSADGAWWLLDYKNGIDPKQFGAKFDGTTDDTDAWQDTVDFAGANVVPITSNGGTSLLKVKTPSLYTYGNLTNLVFAAVTINYSNLSISGNFTILFKGDGITASNIGYAFSTLKNMTIGTVKNIEFDGLTFDFNPTGDPGSITKRAIAIIGFNNVKLNNLTMTSSGSRAGGTITLQNGSVVDSDNYRLVKVTQGWNFSYVSHVTMSNHYYENCSECIDFDRVGTYLNLDNLEFYNTNSGGVSRTGQCIDLNSCQFVNVNNVNCQEVGNVVTINYKTTTPPTYYDYVNNVAVSVYTPSKSVTVSNVNVNGANAGSTNAVIILGIDRTSNTEISCENITLENINLHDTGVIQSEDVVNLVIDGLRMFSCRGVDSTSFGLVTVVSDVSYSNARASVTMRNVLIDTTNYFAIKYAGCTSISQSNVKLVNINTSGSVNGSKAIRYETLASLNCQVTIDNTSIDTVGNASSVGHYFTDDGVAQEYDINWGGGNRVVGVVTPISLIGDSYKYVRKQITVPLTVGPLAVTGAGNYDVGLLSTGENGGLFLCNVVYNFSATIAASGADYVGYAIRSLVAGTDTVICSTTDTAGITAGSQLASGYTPPEVAATLGDNDLIYCRMVKAGAGRTLNGVSALVSYMDYSIV